jgi:phage terminase large subunit GpA-like protein
MQPALAADIFAQPLPDFFPESLRRACAGKQIRYTLPRAVRERMQVPEDLTVSQWAEKHRRVTEIDAQPGRWRQDLVPHTKKPMDTISLPWVKEAWLCMVERSAKTQILLNACMRQIDRGIDSGNVFWLMPSQHDANKALGERIVPALKASPRTSRLLSRYADDTTRSLIRFKHGPRLIPAWSNSPGSISSFYGKLNIGDEVDKYSSLSGGETDPITLLKKRGRDSDESKFLFASTPASKFIYKGMLACQQIWAFKNRCPHCDESVLMDAEHFVIPPAATVESVKHGQDPVTYACNACGVEWDEADRADSYQLGDWAAIKGADVDRPVSVGFHMPAFPLPNIKMAEIGAAIVRARSGDLAAKMDLAHGYEAIDYEQARATSDYLEVLRLCDDRPRDLVPDAAAVLVLNVDTQQDGFYYEVSAVGPWDGQTEPTTWLVSKGYLLDFASLVTLAARTWHSAGGKQYRIISALIDSGGTRKAGAPAGHSRTAEVYAFCKQNPLFKPVKGTGRKQGAPVTYSIIDRFPGTAKAIPGGLRLILLDVHYYKDELARRLQLDPEAPGAFVLYSGYTAAQLAAGVDPAQNELTDYAKHLCAEYKTELGLWEHDQKAGRNDYHDCATYRMYHIDLLKQWGSLTPEAITRPIRRIISKGVSQNG